MDAPRCGGCRSRQWPRLLASVGESVRCGYQVGGPCRCFEGTRPFRLAYLGHESFAGREWRVRKKPLVSVAVSLARRARWSELARGEQQGGASRRPPE